jgi:hypothetical protein
MSTHEDANLILRLYEMRRDDRMRQARNWYVSTFKATTLEEFDKLCLPGSDEHASFRMVTSYWEMVASFLNSGALDKELFYKSGNELLFVWLRLSALVPALRERFHDTTVSGEMEAAANEMIAWKKSRSAEGFEMFSKRVRGV